MVINLLNYSMLLFKSFAGHPIPILTDHNKLPPTKIHIKLMGVYLMALTPIGC